jgi:hypothetical protein
LSLRFSVLANLDLLSHVVQVLPETLDLVLQFESPTVTLSGGGTLR